MNTLYSDYTMLCLQGPAGKDGLPGHPGQRGEPVSLNKGIHVNKWVVFLSTHIHQNKPEGTTRSENTPEFCFIFY